jgi:tight adherence protein C
MSGNLGTFLLSALPEGITPEDALTMATGVVAFLVIWSIGQSVVERDRMAPRLKAIQERRRELKDTYLAPRRRKQPMQHSGWMKTIVMRLKVMKDIRTDAIGRTLNQAGYRSKDAIYVYAFLKFFSPLAGLGVALLLFPPEWGLLWGGDTDALGSFAAVLATAWVSGRLPDLLLHNQRSKRYALIRKALPDTLDLMLICAEAGLSLVAALDRVARELGQAYPEMAEELSLTSVEIGFLPERNTALTHLAERLDMQEVRSMVNVLLQTEKYGTPISQALRVLSKDFRTERMLRAEQKAARLPALLTVPMILFILPTMFIVVMTPAILRVMDAM